MTSVVDLLTTWKDEYDEKATRVEAMSRGAESDRIAVPLLGGAARQVLVAGTRAFHLPWVGGKPPFSVQIAGEGGDPVTLRAPSERLVAGTIVLEEGFYEVRVTDADGRSARGAFEVTAWGAEPDRRGIDQLPPNLGPVLLAARLAGLDGGVWNLEAYERLSALPDNEAARVTANRLAHGQSIAALRTQSR